jgi:hypothetical protein
MGTRVLDEQPQRDRLPVNERLRAIGAKLDALANQVTEELERTCARIEFEKLESLDFADVILGLLARAYQLWIVAVLSPAASTTPVAPLILRALADSVITTAWIGANPASAGQYKLYSAGRLKLLSEQWRSRQTPETKAFVEAYAEELTDMVNSERWSAIVDVELGNWNGKDVRTMALETGLKDLYDLAYSPMSADAHGEWMVLRKNFLRPCLEVLHPTHWLPKFERPHRITNFPPAATDHFAIGVTIALDALQLDYQPEFWDWIRNEMRAAVKEVDVASAEADELGLGQSSD